MSHKIDPRLVYLQGPPKGSSPPCSQCYKCYCLYIIHSGTDESELSDLDGEFNLGISSRYEHGQVGGEQELEGIFISILELPLL